MKQHALMRLLWHSFTRSHSPLPHPRVPALPWSREISLLKYRRRQLLHRRPRTRSRACSPEQPPPARLRRARNTDGFPRHARRVSRDHAIVSETMSSVIKDAYLDETRKKLASPSLFGCQAPRVPTTKPSTWTT